MAFRELVAAYGTYIYQTIYAVVRHKKDAEDLSQDVWTRIYFSLPQYENRGLKTWITRIAVNRAIDFKRSASRRQEDIVEEPQTHLPLGASLAEVDIEHEVMLKETAELVRRKLHQIPDNYQDVLIAFYIHHQSYQDIAEMQGIAVKTVESKLYRAKQWLRQHWKEEDFQ
ncbi:RNA polymerase sigma factor [Paenibacillus whitsoniae]|uniref:RNA polymerase sigma factor n=1 Tax=Paenibacillus whitsoniae TaxID=2496558 RepID=UPI001F493277|nr:sigma-70 family RNA polymerase sigma factor [Paenibacillus whitsoniae]